MVHDDTKLTRTGTILGTPAYMSPEQARGLPVDGRSDLFSLGCVLYRACVGEHPFAAPNTMALLTALAVDTPRDLSEIEPAIPAAFSDLVMQLLAKAPEQRPESAEAVLTRLDAIEAGVAEPAARRASAPPASPPQPRAGRRRWLTLGVSAGLLTIVGSVALIVKWWNAGPVSDSLLARSPLSPPAGDWVHLGDLPEAQVERWPFPGPLPPLPGEEWDMRPRPRGGARVRVRGRPSPHGIFMHPFLPGATTSSITWALDEKFRTFWTQVSLNDGPLACAPMVFVVHGDGRVLWQSRPVSSQEDAQEQTIDITGVDRLKLEVRFSGEMQGAQAVWVEPSVSR